MSKFLELMYLPISVLYPEDGSINLLRNVGNYIPYIYTVIKQDISTSETHVAYEYSLFLFISTQCEK